MAENKIYWKIENETTLYLKNEYEEGYEEYQGSGPITGYGGPSFIRVKCLTPITLYSNSNRFFARYHDLLWCDLSLFDTSNVTDMSFMFEACTSLRSLNLSSFDTSNVTSMTGMFWSCCTNSHVSTLNELDLSNFDTSNVTNFSEMFKETGFSKLYLKNFDMTNALDTSQMFYCSNNLTRVYTDSDWELQATNIRNYEYMFAYCNLPNQGGVSGVGDIHNAHDCNDKRIPLGFLNEPIVTRKIAYNNKIIENSDKIIRNFLDIKKVYRNDLKYWEKE